MLAVNTGYPRRSHFVGTPTTIPSIGSSGVYLTRPRLLLRNCLKPKILGTSTNNTDLSSFAQMKRLKAKKANGIQKMDFNKKKSMDYTEMAYREAVSKLKYLLADSYVPKISAGKMQPARNLYQNSNTRINESVEDIDERSIISDNSRMKDIVENTHVLRNSYSRPAKPIQHSKVYSNLAISSADLQSVPPELTSFIERQEEYIEQLERESQYCKEELSNLLRKVREVVAENEALQNKNKSGFLKCVLEEHKNISEGPIDECENENCSQTEKYHTKSAKILEGPSIVFESRISELEAQLTQTRRELRKVQEENQANIKRLSENSVSDSDPQKKIEIQQALRAKSEAELKLDDLEKSLALAREKEAGAIQKAQRSIDAMQQTEFEKTQCEAEIRRLKDELDRQHEKLREASQESNRRLAEERQQVERRYSQQIEQLSADIASHWDAATKSQLESEKQRRELAELRRELTQKQALIDNMKKEMQNKISSLQRELNEAITEKDASEQEVLATKLITERCERQSRQEQNRLQAEINSYRQRLERADNDLVHCRRENLRLSEQIASLEKEINMSKVLHSEESHGQTSSKQENEKELSSMIMDIETKHAATVAGLEEALNNQATIVSQLTTECQSLTQRLEANDLKHKEEMASLQSNIEYLSNKIQGAFNDHKGLTAMEGKGDSMVYNLDISFDPSVQVHENNNVSGANYKLNHQNYDSMAINNSTVNDISAKESGSIIEDNDKSPEKFNISNEDSYNIDNELKTDANCTIQTYDQQNKDSNAEQKYTGEGDNLESYDTEEHYNQTEQCNPLEYQQEGYTDENNYNAQEIHDGTSYPRTDVNQATSDAEFVQ